MCPKSYTVGPQQYMPMALPLGSSGTNSSTERERVLKNFSAIGSERRQPRPARRKEKLKFHGSGGRRPRPPWSRGVSPGGPPAQLESARESVAEAGCPPLRQAGRLPPPLLPQNRFVFSGPLAMLPNQTTPNAYEHLSFAQESPEPRGYLRHG